MKTELENLREIKTKLTGRIKEYQDKLKVETDAQKRISIKAKIRSYRSACQDIQVQIDHLDPPSMKKARKESRVCLNIGMLNYDFFERSGNCWSDIDGHTWQQVEAGDFVELGTSMQQLQEWLAEGSERLTEKQKLYIDAYYNDGLSMEMIAEQFGVGKSTVARVIKNGMARMQEWVEAKKLITECSDGKGGFDWETYLGKVPVLTDRQKQLMLLILSKAPHNQYDLADKLELKQSTVSRTINKATDTIQKLNVYNSHVISRPNIEDWEQADKFVLALRTNMPLYFYYRFCFRDQKVGGISRYNYELSRRREAGISVDDVAEELGLKPKTVRSAYCRLKRQGVNVSHLSPPQDGTIGSRLDHETYVKLQRMVTSRAFT